MANPDKMPAARKKEALRAAERALECSAAVVHEEMNRGVSNLATIASTAPLIGLSGAIWGMHNSFLGVNGSKESITATIFEGLSHAFMQCGFGLLVALVAMWCYKYLLTAVEVFDSEMEAASLHLINDLRHLYISKTPESSSY